ncbi:MAG: hypothetical protein ACRDKW_07375 [Actinomycetota bacterium]
MTRDACRYPLVATYAARDEPADAVAFRCVGPGTAGFPAITPADG